MNRKYEFTDYILNHHGIILRRIKRISDGALGGWIENEHNLSHEGTCWVDNDAKVFGNARIYGNARIFENAKAFGNAKMFGCTNIFGNASVSDDAWVFENSSIFGNAKISGKVKIYGNAMVFGNAKVYKNAFIYGNAQVCEDAEVSTKAFNLNYYLHSITMTDYHVRVGTVQMLAPEWLLLGENDAFAMGFYKDDYRKIKQLLKVAIPHHFGKALV